MLVDLRRFRKAPTFIEVSESTSGGPKKRTACRRESPQFAEKKSQPRDVITCLVQPKSRVAYRLGRDGREATESVKCSPESRERLERL